MSLFAEDTVIIVGAGASVPFGLPTGAEMIDLIIHEFKREAKGLHSGPERVDELRLMPERAPISYALCLEGDPTKQIVPCVESDRLKELASWLEQQTGDSIDDIIRHNPSRAKALKVGICKVLFEETYTIDIIGTKYYPKEFDGRIFSKNVKFFDRTTGREKEVTKDNRNWIYQFINLARSQLLTVEQDGIAPDSKIKVVSFNYDGILEYVLDKKWKNIETEFGDWSDHFEIVHPHGTIVIKHKVEKIDLAKLLHDNAEKISVVHDGLDQCDITVAEHRTRARDFCVGAANVYAIGFAFARANIRLIGLDCPVDRTESQSSNSESDKMSMRLAHYINYDDSFGLRNRVKKVCERASSGEPDHPTHEMVPQEMTAGPGRRLEISEALIAGFLGEMPA